MLSNDNHNNFQLQRDITMDRPLETKSAPPSPSFKSSFRSNRRTTSLDLDLPRLRSLTTTPEPIFCCQVCTSSIQEEDIDNFGQIGSTCPPFQGSVRSINPEHVITVDPITKNPKPNTPKKPIRYYVYLESVNEYREIDSILFTYLQDVTGFDEEASKARLTCSSHRQTYNLTRYTIPQSESRLETSSDSDTECSSPQSEAYSSSESYSASDTEGSSPQFEARIPSEYFSESDIESNDYESTLPLSQLSSCTSETYGTASQPLSPRQISVEKRRFMIRKLSYGRKEQMEEIIQSAAILDEDRSRRDRWGWQGRRHKKEAQEMLDFEVKYCLGKMRMFFLDGKTSRI